MAQQCRVCASGYRQECEKMLLEGKSFSSVSLWLKQQKINCSYKAVQRHAENHMSRDIVEASQERNLEAGKNAHQLINEMIVKCDSIMNSESSSATEALKAVGELRNTMAFMLSLGILDKKQREKEQLKKVSIAQMKDMYSRLNKEELELLSYLLGKAQGEEVFLKQETFSETYCRFCRQASRNQPGSTNDSQGIG